MSTGSHTAGLQLDIFHNTIHLNGKELRQAKLTAAGQCRVIYDFFRGNPAQSFTPFDVQQHANMHRTPITSIRRAINTLTVNGLLIKTEVMREGQYGVKNHTWRLA